MADDWRLRVTLAGGSGGLGGMGTRLKARDLARELTRQLGERIAVSRDGDELFLYAGTEDAARAAEDAVRGDMDQHDVSGEIELSRWHEEAEDWQPAEAALPATEEQRAAERARRIAREDDRAAAGEVGWEVRVALPSRHAARELADRLEREGVPNIRRWRYLFVATADEDAAREWADRLRGEAPAGSTVTVEGTFDAVQRSRPFGV
jgi:hypothetical protein